VRDHLTFGSAVRGAWKLANWEEDLATIDLDRARPVST